MPTRRTAPTAVAARRGQNAEYALVASLASFGALLAAVRSGRSRDVDLAVTLRLQAFAHPWVGPLMKAVSWPGFPPQSRLIPPAIIGFLAASGLKTEARFQTAAWGTALLSTIVKAFVRRPRPLPPQIRVVVAPLGGTSFPSGHVLTYVGVYGFAAFVAHAVIRPDAARWSVVVPLLALLILVGPSRIQQGHHWPSDVLGSYLLGASYLLVLGELYRRTKAAET